MRSHTVIVQINARPDGFDLDSLLNAIEHLEGVQSAIEVAVLEHQDEDRDVLLTVTIPADATEEEPS